MEPAPRNIVLIGFMGSGKSSVGRELARRCNFRFFDTDSMIRHKHGKSIPEIFSLLGETVFRAEEHSALVHLQNAKGIVLATGGGIVIRPENVPLLRHLGFVVWLTADEETIWNRVQRNTHRPLLQTADPRTTIGNLIAERTPYYRQVADLTVDSSGLTHSEVARRILISMQRSSGSTHDEGRS